MPDKNDWTSRHHEDDDLWEPLDGDATDDAATEHKDSEMTAAQAESLATYYLSIRDLDSNISQKMIESFAGKHSKVAFNSWLVDTRNEHKPFDAFQSAKHDLKEMQYAADVVADVITHSAKKKYQRFSISPLDEALRFANPDTHPDFNGYLDRIVEISHEAHENVADQGQIIAQALMDGDYQAYKQAIDSIATSDIRVIGVTTTPTTTIEKLEEKFQTFRKL